MNGDYDRPITPAQLRREFSHFREHPDTSRINPDSHRKETKEDPGQTNLFNQQLNLFKETGK